MANETTISYSGEHCGNRIFKAIVSQLQAQGVRQLWSTHGHIINYESTLSVPLLSRAQHLCRPSEPQSDGGTMTAVFVDNSTST